MWDVCVVIFDSTFRSYGSGYNTDHSLFQCPVSGYYMFFVSLYTDLDQLIAVRVFIDGEVSNPQVYSTRYENNASNLVVAHCDLDQLVWVKADVAGTLRSSNAASFTGTLLHAD